MVLIGPGVKNIWFLITASKHLLEFLMDLVGIYKM